MLLLVGLGLDVGEITVKALKALKDADVIYYEDYTNPIRPEMIEALEGLLEGGKKIERIDRSTMEEASGEKLIEPAKSKTVAVLVPGDPLSATTHTSLILQAKTEGVECLIFHAPSILTAVAECGLQLYKFGRTVTLPEEGDACPESVYNYIVQNRVAGLHSLVLLDVGMAVVPALRKLLDADTEGVIGEVVVLSRLGIADQQSIVSGRADKLAKQDEGEAFFGNPPHCIVVIGETHFFEKEFLDEVAKPA